MGTQVNILMFIVFVSGTSVSGVKEGSEERDNERPSGTRPGGLKESPGVCVGER